MRASLLSPQLLLDYLVELGSALMQVGCPTHRLEEALVNVARVEGHEVDVFAVPTGLFVGLRTPQGEASLTTMLRVSEWTLDLERLSALDTLIDQVTARTIDIPEARLRIREVLQRKPQWGAGAQLLGSVASSSGAAITFGGGWTDALMAAFGSSLVFAVMRYAKRDPGARVLETFLGGLIAAVAAWVSTLLWPGHSREVLVLSIIIPLLPGLTLTTGLSELTYRNLVAGTARLMHAAITLLSLAFGIAMVVGLENAVGVHSEPAQPLEPLGWGFQVLALVVAGGGFGVLLGLGPDKLAVAIGSGAVVWAITTLTRPLPGAHAAFLNAFALAVGANISARVSRRPSQLFLMPGMLLLVPGALSFRSLDSLLSGDAVGGLGGLADVTLIAGALVMGLIVANVAVPPRKVL
jgi:uncharacterized membrane protein YjjP (DUF1212 family)